MSINVVPARKNRDPPVNSGGIFVTAIFIPKYVLPQMTYTNPKHVMVMATGFEDGEFTDDTSAQKRFWRAHDRGEQVDARKIS
jgi:ADP-ribosylglycohydrolase